MARSPAILWCEICNDWKPCRSESPSLYGESDVRQRETSAGVHLFERMRRCDDCHNDFVTVEIEDSIFNKMEKALSTLEGIKKAIRSGK